MAARVNTKLILILGVSLIASVGVIGGLWYLKVRGDAGRSARIGDEYLAQGDLEKARDYYRSAVRKEPGSLEFLQKHEDVLLKYQPTTSDEAVLWFSEWLGVLRHRAVNFSNDGVSPIRLLSVLHQVARRANLGNYWHRLENEATVMLDRMRLDDPQRPLAAVYLNLSRIRLGQDTLTLEEMAEAEQALAEAVEALEEDDLAWASLLTGQGAMIQRMQKSGQTRPAQKKIQELLVNVAKAAQAVPQGIDTARASLLGIGLIRMQQGLAGAMYNQQIADGVVRLKGLLEKHDPEPWLIKDCATLLLAFPEYDGTIIALEVLERYLDAHPDELDLRMIKARIHFTQLELDLSWEAADAALNAPDRTVSYLAIFQNQLRRAASAQIGDIEFSRWELADESQKASQLQALRDVRPMLVKYVANQDADVQVMKLDGLIAYAEGDYSMAVSRLEAMIQAQGGADALTYTLDARALERINQFGRAQQRIVNALESQPRNVVLRLDKARLEFLIGRFGESRQTVNDVLRIDPGNERALAILKTMDATESSRLDGDESRIIAILRDVDKAITEGNSDVARTTLQEGLASFPRDLKLLEKMIAVESGAGDLDAANRYLERALKLSPDSVRFRQIKATLSSDDPVEVILRYAEFTHQDETDRAVSMLYNLNALSIQQEILALRQANRGEIDEAAESRELAARARAAAQQHLKIVEQHDADHPAIVDYHYAKAIAEEDWDAAEAQIRRARELNLDHAQGRVYQGRYEMARKRYAQAMQTLKQATRDVHYSSTVWKTLAVASEGAGDYTEASRAYGEAYDCNPTDIDNARRYANMLVRGGDKSRALRILQDSYNLSPGNIPLREEWLNLEEEVGLLSVVLKTRLRHIAKDPGDFVNTALLAEFYGYRMPRRNLLIDDQFQEQYTLTAWSQYSALQQQELLLLIRQDWRRISELLLEELSEITTDPYNIVQLRAQIARKRGDANEGWRVMREYLERFEPEKITLAMRLAYASFLMDIDRAEDAIEVLKEAIDQQDEKRREVDGALSRVYVSLGSYDLAIPHLEKILAVSEQRELKLQLITCYIRALMFEQAERALGELVESGASEFTISLVRSSIALQQAMEQYSAGDIEAAQQMFSDAREALTMAESLNPSDPQPHLQLARNYLAEYRLVKDQDMLTPALMALDRAERLDPTSSIANELRVELLVAQGNIAGATNELIDVLRGNPSNATARQQLIQLFISSQRGEEAIRLTREAVDLDPNAQLWHVILGDLIYTVHGDVAASIEEYAEAYSIRSEPATLAKLLSAMLFKSPPEYAEIQRLIEAETFDTQSYPEIQALLARAMLGQGRTTDALQQMRLSYGTYQQAFEKGELSPDAIARWFGHLMFMFPAQDPGDLEAFTMEMCDNDPTVYELRGLSGVYLRPEVPFETHVQHIIDLQSRAIEATPVGADELKVNLLNELASIYIRGERFAAAAETYRRILEFTPNDVFVMNNFAYLLAAHLGKPADALEPALRAVELNPQNSDLLDTLGWVYFKLGEYELAARNLELSITMRGNLSGYLHLATVLIELGELDLASQRLQQVKRFVLDEQTQAEIDRLNDDIERKRLQGG